MTTAEFESAKKLAEQLPLPVQPVRRRRHEAATTPRHGGRLDLRATMQRMARQPHTLQPLYTRPREELPALKPAAGTAFDGFDSQRHRAASQPY